MKKEELKELKRKRENIDKEIQEKEWRSFKNRWKQMTFIEKLIFIIGVIGLIIILYNLGGYIGRLIG